MASNGRSSEAPIRLLHANKGNLTPDQAKHHRRRGGGHSCSPWTIFSYVLTFWAIPPILSWVGGMKDLSSQRAFREKISLCFIIMCLCGVVAFLTFFLPFLLCPPTSYIDNSIKYQDAIRDHLVWAYGKAYDVSQVSSYFSNLQIPQTGDISSLFPPKGPCGTYSSVFFKSDLDNAHFSSARVLMFEWEDLALAPGKLVAINGIVVNITMVKLEQEMPSGSDASFSFANSRMSDQAACLFSRFEVGMLSKDNPGCFLAKAVLAISLFTIVFVVLLRFIMAVVFSWFLSTKISPKRKKNTSYGSQKSSSTRLASIYTPTDHGNTPDAKFCFSNSELSNLKLSSTASLASLRKNRLFSLLSPTLTQSADAIPTTKISPNSDMYVLLLVTCYSEGKDAITATLNSLCEAEYDAEKRLLVVIADGVVVGSGNSSSTPDILLSLMSSDTVAFQLRPSSDTSSFPVIYDSIGEGTHASNGALVYAGYYFSTNGTTENIPMLLIVKTGITASEVAHANRPGNRGKRDSQMILIHFLIRVLFDDRMTELDYVIFNSIFILLGVTADLFEAVLMVDADTRVEKGALKVLVNALQADSMIMGLCGETRISNKRDSWVTKIQVFEYYISHHLGKAFESVFGGVTCLPGCFCMYRIKAPKSGGWVPLLASPEVAVKYAENKTDTLHKKNLLLLGEDRYLSTLLLKCFPKRKLMFVPDALCHTVVPSKFSILLSQRRRWINSTIHNLLELLLVRDLCGIFCCSMQFVVFMELIGTLVLPAAITFTAVLIVVSISNPMLAALPLALLVLILGLPAVLILITTRKFVYIGWMAIYLLALPIWNFVLPLYAYWHFDDFSWGETRKVAPKKELSKDERPSMHQQRDNNAASEVKVPQKRWSEWTRSLYSPDNKI